MAMISTIQLDRDNKIKDLDKNVTSFQNTTTALEKEFSDIKETTDHQTSIIHDKIFSLKAKNRNQKKYPHNSPQLPNQLKRF